MPRKSIVLGLFLKSTYFFTITYIYLLIFTFKSAIKSGFPNLKLTLNFAYIFVFVLLIALIIMRDGFSRIIIKQNSEAIKHFSKLPLLEEFVAMVIFFRFFNKIFIISILCALFFYYAALYFYFLPEKEKAEKEMITSKMGKFINPSKQ